MITGAAGLIGAALADECRRLGLAVTEAGRRTTPPFVLGEPIPAHMMDGADIVVHAAWAFDPDEGPRVNATGTQDLLDAARSTGVRRTIVISSMSAADNVSSSYARQKRDVEDIAKRYGASVVRPGLVWSESGATGLVASMRRLARLPIVPIPRAAGARLHLVEARDLARVLLHVSQSEISPPHLTVAHPEPLSIGDIVRRAGALQGRMPITVPIPRSVMAASLAAGRWVGLPFSKDNLEGLLCARPCDRLDPEPFGISLQRFPG